MLMGIVWMLFWLSALNWLNDLFSESYFAFTSTESFSVRLSIKWLIVSEAMLFLACSWGMINFRPSSPGFPVLFTYPLLTTSSFAIPVSNPFIPLSPTFPFKSASSFVKIGFLFLGWEGVGQSVSLGLLFIILQCKEFS